MSKKKQKLCKGFNKPTKEEINSMQDFLNSSYAINNRYDDDDDYQEDTQPYYDEDDEDEYYASEIGRDLFGDPSYRYGTPIKEVINQKKQSEEATISKSSEHKESLYNITPHDQFGIKIELDVRDPNMGRVSCSMKSRRSSVFMNGLTIPGDDTVGCFNYNKIKRLYDTTDNVQPIVSGIFRTLLLSSTPDVIIREEDISEFTENIKSFSNENVFIDYKSGKSKYEGYYYIWTIDKESRSKFIKFVTIMMGRYALLSTAVQVLQHSTSAFNGIIPLSEVSDYVSSISEIEDFSQYLKDKKYVVYKDEDDEETELNAFSDGLAVVSNSLAHTIDEYMEHQNFETPAHHRKDDEGHKNPGSDIRYSAEEFGQVYDEEEDEDKLREADKISVADIRSSMEEFGQVYDEEEDDDLENEESKDLSIYQMSGDGYEEELDGDLIDDENDSTSSPDVKQEDGRIVFTPLRRKG